MKTDRIDAADLAEFYANGLLTIVTAPDAELEQDRDLLRSRQRLIQHQGDLRRHILSLLRRNGLHYKAECNSKTHWRTHQRIGQTNGFSSEWTSIEMRGVGELRWIRCCCLRCGE